MSFAHPSASDKSIKTSGYAGGLARSLVRTLLIFTFIPLTLMAGAAYLRSRTLLREQVVSQMQAQLTIQLGQVDRSVKTKEIRLDRLVRGSDLAVQVEAALSGSSTAVDLETLRTDLGSQLRSVNPDIGQTIFNQYILMKPDGTILLSSKPDWEGRSLKTTSYFQTLSESDRQSFALYDAVPLYPGQLVLLTISQYRNSTGAELGTLVGITEPQQLQSVLANLAALNADAEALFVTPGGTIIGTDPYTNQISVVGLPSSQQSIITTALDKMMNSTAAQPESIDFTDQSGQAAFGQVLWLPSMHAGIVYEIHQEKIFGPLNSLIPFTIAVFLITLVAMVMVLSIGTTRVFQPLVVLAEITHKFAQGDFSQRAEARSKDEIGMLAQSFNQMAEELSGLYRSLEQKVEERTRQIRTAAEVAQRITSTTNLNELLNRTVELIVEQFSFYQASIFMLDHRGRFAVLQASHGPAAHEMLERGHRLETGSASIIGWVAANNKPRVASDVAEDPMHLRNELLPETRSEVGIPISVGNSVLGALDVQSKEPSAFGADTIVMLQLLASQIAVAIENVGLVESAQINFQELERLQRAGRQIASAQTDQDVFQVAVRVLRDAPNPALVFELNDQHQFQLQGSSDFGDAELLSRARAAARRLESGFDEVERILVAGSVLVGAGSPSISVPFTGATAELGYPAVGFLPVMRGDTLTGLITIGALKGTLTNATLQPYANMADLIGATLERISESEQKEQQLSEREALTAISLAVTSAPSKNETLQTTARMLKDTPYPAIVLSADDRRLEIEGLTKADGPEELRVRTAVKNLEASLSEAQKFLSTGPVIAESAHNIPFPLTLGLNVAPNFKPVEFETQNLPVPLIQFAKDLNYQTAAFLPIMSNNKLTALIIIGGPKQTLTSALIQPYTSMADLIKATLERISESEQKERQLSEREALTSISQAMTASSTELANFYSELHRQIRRNIGDYAFILALYDKVTESISIPYAFEEGHVNKIDAFPLGEGLTSILIRTGKPLLLVEDVDKRALEFGAKPFGKPARSWMGAPMMIQGEPIGALILWDLEHEHAFQEENLNFFIALANQVAAVIQNTHLLEESRLRAFQLETAAIIARDISGSLNLDELLSKAVGFIRERFNFYHAAIFLIDAVGEFAVVREATGEAGVQMKRAGHKLGVGSKSIVGFAAGRGEPLIVNDTAKDATYYPNPLLPNTRSEAAIPLRIGERTLGVLDVQSEHPYAFSADNLRTLQILGDQLAVAVINSELFAETQEHLSQHRLLHHITTSAASGTTVEEALESAVTGLQVTLGGDRVAILLADRDKKQLDVKAAAGYSEDVLHLSVPMNTGVTGWAATHRRALRVGDVSEDPRYIMGSSNSKSELAIPLIYRNEVLGVLNVESEKTNAYAESDEEMLGTLGGSLAAIIANARLLEQIRAQAERERTVFEITNKIRRSTNMEAILSTTVSELTKAVGARQASIKISAQETNGDAESKDAE